MLEKIGDFKYVPLNKISGFLEDGADLACPLPVRAGCASSLPFSEDGDLNGNFCGDLRVIDTAWLMEAVQERESFLTGHGATVPSSILKTPYVMASELLAVARALKTWASRWETGAITNVFVDEGAESDVSDKWQDVVGVTMTAEYDEKDLDDCPVIRYLDPWAEMSSWSPSGSDAQKITLDGLSAVVRKHALRNYLSVPRFLGLETDDDLETGSFSWKNVEGWKGKYPPVVKSSDVLALYSDLEATRFAVIDFEPDDNRSRNVEDKRDESDHYVNEDWNLWVDHNIKHLDIANLSFEGCPSFWDDKHTVSSYDSPTTDTTTRTVSIAPATKFLDWSGGYVGITGLTGLACKIEAKETRHIESYDTAACVSYSQVCSTCYSQDKHISTRLNRFMCPLPTQTSDETVEVSNSRELKDEITMDVTSRWWEVNPDRNLEIESASVLVASLAVAYESEAVEHQMAGAYQSPTTDYRDATDFTAYSECKVNVRIKRVPCDIRDGHIIVVPSIDVESVPDASGGEHVQVELNDRDAEKVPGTRISSPRGVREVKTKGSRKAILGIGPVFVKFKPKTSVKE